MFPTSCLSVDRWYIIYQVVSIILHFIFVINDTRILLHDTALLVITLIVTERLYYQGTSANSYLPMWSHIDWIVSMDSCQYSYTIWCKRISSDLRLIIVLTFKLNEQLLYLSSGTYSYLDRWNNLFQFVNILTGQHINPI